MLILMGLAFVGIIVSIKALISIGIGIGKKNYKRIFIWLLVPCLYWAGLLWLIEEDRKAVEKIMEEDPDTWQEQVW